MSQFSTRFNLFQATILEKQIAGQCAAIDAAYEKFSATFRDAKNQEFIRSMKEEEFQEGFLRKLFVEVLGYTLRSDDASQFNLVRELKNETDQRKVDGAIILNGVVRAVIELKDTKTIDLKKAEAQAFGYKVQHKNAIYVISSNFEKLRFYIDNATEYMEWNLFTLSRERFGELWVCLAFENLSQDVPKQLKEKSISREDEITRKFYKQYKQFKDNLFADLIANNPALDKLTLFVQTQKLLDRVLFIRFAESYRLLPINTIKEHVIGGWKQVRKFQDNYPLCDHLKKIFGFLDKGRQELKIYGYNGGLFQTDETLDGLNISDPVLQDLLVKLSDYDFHSEVDINILGHIFEHSLSEVEKIKHELTAVGESAPPKNGKRKKDGIFYTPRYITRYIVESTLGRLCDEKKSAMGINDEWLDAAVNTKGKRKKTVAQACHAVLEVYREWLLSLTICDPACGSGAFLNAALDFLKAEHQSIDEMFAKIDEHPLVMSEFDNEILRKNLYGVDLNEESVEITRLALWLRTAREGRKLCSLDANIKCGNSLISDPDVAGYKAFDWHEEYPHVFQNGGFDVVVGNPPYVRLDRIKLMSEMLTQSKYQTYDKRGDLYAIFVERGFQLLKQDGRISFIMSNKWIQATYGKSLREFFLSKRLLRLIDLGDIQHFEGATTYPCIFVAENGKPNKTILVSVVKSCKDDEFVNQIRQSEETLSLDKFSGETWIVSSQKDKNLVERLKKECVTLEKFVSGEAKCGLKTGLTEAFLIDGKTKERLIAEDAKAVRIIKPALRGRDIKPWIAVDDDCFVIETFPSLCINIDDYPSVKRHLLSFDRERLEQSGKNGSRKKTPHKWFETQDTTAYWKDFAKPKIMYQRFQVKPCFIYDEKGFYCNDSMWIIPSDNKALLAILNSRMGWWLITKYCTQIRNGYQLIWQYFGKIPIPKRLPKTLKNLADKMLSLNADLQLQRKRFLKRLTDNFDGVKITGALERFETLDFKQLLAEFKKQKITIPPKQQAEWEDFFTESTGQVQAMLANIRQTDAQIDQMVYDLYGLTDEEIGIVNRE